MKKYVNLRKIHELVHLNIPFETKFLGLPVDQLDVIFIRSTLFVISSFAAK